MITSIGLGLIVGVILALTGAGGGILAVPLLIFGAHLGVAQAGPIGLLAVAMAAALGAALGLKAGTVRYRAALLIAGTGMALSPVGLWLARHTDNRWLSILFALVMLVVAYRTFRYAGKGRLRALVQTGSPPPPCIRDEASGRFIWTSRCARSLSLSGAVAGLLSGLLGVGGGFVMVPVLQRYTDLEMESIVPTSLAVIALVSVTGVASSALAGDLNWHVALPFSIGSLAGMIGGRQVARLLGGVHLQKGFALISAIVAVGMIAKVAW